MTHDCLPHQVRAETAAPLNWAMLWSALWEDHTRPDLLWNQRTREELREAVQSEVKDLRRAQTLSLDQQIQWNHLEFEVRSPLIMMRVEPSSSSRCDLP